MNWINARSSETAFAGPNVANSNSQEKHPSSLEARPFLPGKPSVPRGENSYPIPPTDPALFSIQKPTNA
jgi:hypothetical protein